MQPMLCHTPMSTTTSRLPPAIKAPDQIDEAPILQDTVPATPESVAKALEDNVGLNFEKYYKRRKLEHSGSNTTCNKERHQNQCSFYGVPVRAMLSPF